MLVKLTPQLNNSQRYEFLFLNFTNCNNHDSKKCMTKSMTDVLNHTYFSMYLLDAEG